MRRTLYLALVRSQYGYATQVWAPQSIKLIAKLERTQRRATKFILNLPFSCTMDYNTRLLSLSLIPICYWHEYLDMVFFFKATHGLVSLKSSILPVIRTSRPTRSSTSNVAKFVTRKCKTTTYQRSFFIRTCRIWNSLADELNFNMDSLNSFKSVMSKYYFAALETCYNCEDPRTLKTICLKCNSSRSLTRPVSCCM